jgi:hypothetical protein
MACAQVDLQMANHANRLAICLSEFLIAQRMEGSQFLIGSSLTTSGAKGWLHC